MSGLDRVLSGWSLNRSERKEIPEQSKSSPQLICKLPIHKSTKETASLYKSINEIYCNNQTLYDELSLRCKIQIHKQCKAKKEKFPNKDHVCGRILRSKGLIDNRSHVSEDVILIWESFEAQTKATKPQGKSISKDEGLNDSSEIGDSEKWKTFQAWKKARGLQEKNISKDEGNTNDSSYTEDNSKKEQVGVFLMEI